MAHLISEAVIRLRRRGDLGERKLSLNKQIGRALGVRYVLEGSVRRSASRVRVSAQLIDAENDAHLWAERFDRDTGDLFAVQNEITSQIAVALNVELVGAEFKRPTVQPDALGHVLRARALYLGRVPTRQNYAAQIALYEHALGLHPGSEKVQSFLAWQLAARVLDQMTGSAASDIARAEMLADQALTMFPSTALAHYAKAQVLRAQQRFEGAISEYERVLELNRNWVHAIAALGHCRFVTGSIEAVIPAQERAIRLSPRDPKIWLFYYWIGQTKRSCGLRRRAAPIWNIPPPRVSRLNLCPKRRDGASCRRTRPCPQPEWRRSIYEFARLRAVGPFRVPNIRTLFETSYLLGPHKAGMPEH